MTKNGRPPIRVSHVKPSVVSALDARCWGRRAEFHRRHLESTMNLSAFYRALRGEPVSPEVVVAIEKAVQLNMRSK